MAVLPGLEASDLRAALAEVQQRVRTQPSDPKPRILLFQLQAVLGEWSRAMNQLQVLADLDAATLPMVHTYREAIRCEELRTKVFAATATPWVFGQPERWLALLLEALRQTADRQYGPAQALRDEAFALAAPVSGTINGEPFAWIADADPRLGPVCEAVVNGAYYWIPFDRLRALRLSAPEDLRDLVWLPAEFVFANGGEAVGLVPTRYPGSEISDDDRIRLGRKTEWQEPAAGVFLGLGQRVLTTDAGEYALLDIREIDLASPPPASHGADEGAVPAAATTVTGDG
jgi:type VI secretion system protein ImpE